MLDEGNDEKKHSQEKPNRDKNSDNHPGDYVNFGRATLCSFGFLGLYMALYSAQNVQSQLLDDDGFSSLGNYSNAFAYLFQGTGSLFCVFIMEKIGTEKSMAYASILQLWFIVALIFPAMKNADMDNPTFWYSTGWVYTVVMITSCMNGFGGGVSQPASGKYISDCAAESNKGFFFAYFWAFYMGSQVFGNLVAAFVLGKLPQVYYVLIMLIVGILAGALLFFLKKPIIINHMEETRQQHLKSVISQDGGRAGSIIHPYTSFVGERLTAWGAIKSMWKLFATKRFMWLAPQCFWTGVSIAYYSGNLVEMMTPTISGDSKDQYFWSMLAMVGFGFGEILGCFFIGFIVDKFGSKVAAFCNVIIIIIMTIVTIAFIMVWEFNWLAWAMAFLWGFQDSMVNTHSQEMLGFEFDNNSEPFSIFNILQCIACFLFQIVESYVGDRDSYFIFTISVGVIGVFCTGLPIFFKFREHLGARPIAESFHGSSGSGSDYKKRVPLIENHDSVDIMAREKSLRLDEQMIREKNQAVNMTNTLTDSSLAGSVRS